MGVLEICAGVLALSYVILAIFQRRLCWIAAIASASLYIVIFWRVQLYLEAALQVFYNKPLTNKNTYKQKKDDKSQPPIRMWSPRQHMVACSALVFLSLLIGSAMARWTDAASPYVDAATTVSALLATWMVARKLLENWLYWIAIDLASIGLYLSRDLSLTATLFAGYVLLAAWGYRTWRAQWQMQTS